MSPVDTEAEIEADDAPASTVFDAAALDGSEPFEALVHAVLHAADRVSAGNLWGSSQALVLAGLVRRAQGPWTAVLSSDAEAESFLDDLTAFGVADATLFPARDARGGAHDSSGADLTMLRDRLQVAQRLLGPAERRPRIVVASLHSLLQPIPSAAELQRDFLTLQVNETLDSEKLLGRLVAAGYERQPLAETPGEVSLRGEILDVYAFAAELPLRIELFGDEIESLRSFDPVDQRSVEQHSKVEVSLVSDAGGIEDGSGVPAFLALAPTTVFVRVEPLRIDDRAEGLRIRSGSHAKALHQLAERLDKHVVLDLQSLPGDGLVFETRSVQRFAVGMREVPPLLAEAATKEHVVVLCRTAAERRRLQEILVEHGAGPDAAPDLAARVGSVSKGFGFPAIGLAIVNHREIVGIQGSRARAARARAPHRVRALQSFFELKVGDLVVHAVHGLARFKGLVQMQRGGGEEEHLHLVFADDVALYVPASRIDLVQRYIGTGSVAPALDKIGSQSFRRRKEKVERALFDLASELLEVQARRALKTRPRWVPEEGDAELVRAMIEEFPWVETDDQVTVDAEIAKDLSGPRAMDRLLCGDVGFGKTELAVRAAFRVVHGGGQVAVLVPTTLLAQQHHDVFRERLADFPVEVGLLSRTVTPSRVKETVAGLAAGRVDIVIGTHRILSKDVGFKNLGLVIVDEEQRFGVAHKEHFKQLRAEVDLLTLSATPIPRTLHMSLSGLRDISALTIPPEGRQEIETRLVDAEDDESLREALLRERNRGGQVFVLHNRVGSIGLVAQRVANLVPESTIAIGHGQMSARELERIMKSFTRGDVDVLVATTIIESGLDIPAAGTIIVDRADEFGLSELHQLRGRVGRSTHKAWCLLLVDRLKPVREIARERLKALEEMNQLGAGFAISMKDLEIRGAGNILGPQQSGHIAAIGYDMYCRLLKKTSDRIQHGADLGGSKGDGDDRAAAAQLVSASQEERGVEIELGLTAYLPPGWVSAADARIEILRQLATIDSDEDAHAAEDSLRDRFGRVPEPARNLVRTFRIQAQLGELAIERLTWRGDFYHLEFGDRVMLERWISAAQHAGLATELRPLRTGVAHLVIPTATMAAGGTAEEAASWLEERLARARPHAH